MGICGSKSAKEDEGRPIVDSETNSPELLGGGGGGNKQDEKTKKSMESTPTNNQPNAQNEPKNPFDDDSNQKKNPFEDEEDDILGDPKRISSDSKSHDDVDSRSIAESVGAVSTTSNAEEDSEELLSDKKKKKKAKTSKSIRSLKRNPGKGMGMVVATIEMCVEYKLDTNSLTVTVIEVRDFDHELFTNYNNFYVKTYLKPDPQKKSKKKTRPQKKAEPLRFDEQIVYEISPKEVAEKQLQVTLWVHGVTNEAFGEVILNLWEYTGEFRIYDNFPFKKKDKDISDTASIKSMDSSLSFDDKKSIAESTTPKLPVPDDFGSINVSLLYDSSKQVLFVTILEAKDLYPTEGGNTANPYVKLSLLPHDKKNKLKTKVHKKTLNPFFNESFEFKVEKNTYYTRRLQLSVWNYDAFGRNQFMGEAMIEFTTVPFDETVKNWLELKPSSVGDIKLSLSVEQNTLSIMIYKIKDLQTTSNETYVKIYLTPDESKVTKKKTEVQKKTNNPEFNQTLTYNLGEIPDANQRVIEISVHDATSKGDSSIGKVLVPIEEVMENKKIVQWYPIVKD